MSIEESTNVYSLLLLHLFEEKEVSSGILAGYSLDEIMGCGLLQLILNEIQIGGLCRCIYLFCYSHEYELWGRGKHHTKSMLD